MNRFQLLLALLFCLHGAKIFRLVPIPSFADDRPVIGYAHLDAHTDIVRDRAFTKTGSVWGYDPYVAAGEPAGFARSPSSISPVLFDRLVRGALRPETSYRLFVFLALLMGPFMLFLAARFLQCGRSGAFLAAALLSAGLVSHDAMSKELIYRGQIAAWLGALTAILNAASLYHLSAFGGRRAGIAFLLTAVLLPTLSVPLTVSQVIPLILIGAFTGPESRRRVAGWLCAGAAAAVALNFHWWNAPRWLFEYSAFGDWSDHGLEALKNLFLPLGGSWGDRFNATTRLYLAVFGVARIIALCRESRRVGWTLAGWGVSLGGLAFFGAYAPYVKNVASATLVFAFTSLLLIPSGVFLAKAMVRPGTMRFVLFGWYVWFALTWQIAHKFDPPPLRTELTSDETRLARDLASLPPGGRVLVQYTPKFTDGLRLAAINGIHTFAGFAGTGWTTADKTYGSFVIAPGGWKLLGYPLSSYTEASLVDRLRRFNVSYVVATTVAEGNYFAEMPSFDPVASGGTAYRIFRLRSPAANGYLLEGSGRLTPSFEGIRIVDASSGTLVTSFLWSPGFRVDPPARAKSVSFPDDTAQFLAIENPRAGAGIMVKHGR